MFGLRLGSKWSIAFRSIDRASLSEKSEEKTRKRSFGHLQLSLVWLPNKTAQK